MQCWQCENFQSKNPLTGDVATLGGGFCRPVSHVTRYRKLRQEACERFKRREQEREKAIKKWLDLNGF